MGRCAGANVRYTPDHSPPRPFQDRRDDALRRVGETRLGERIFLRGAVLTNSRNFPDMRSGRKLRGCAIRRGPVFEMQENR